MTANPLFSIENLRALMKESAAYASLNSEKKQQIENYFTKNDTPALMHVYYTLLEEKNRIDFSRSKLATTLAGAEAKISTEASQVIQNKRKENLQN